LHLGRSGIAGCFLPGVGGPIRQVNFGFGGGGRRFHQRADLQIIDPGLRQARATVQVEHHPVDVGVLDDEVALQLGAGQLNLVPQFFDRLANGQLLPSA